MGWTAPAAIGTDWAVGELATAAKMNSHLSDNLRYLKGMDGAVTIDDNLTSTHATAAILTAQATANTSAAYLKMVAKNAGVTVDYRFLANALSGNEWVLYDAVAAAVRLHVSSAGNVGIGPGIPAAKLHVQGAGGGMLYLSATTVGAALQTLTPTGLVLTGAVFFVSDVNNGTTNPGGFTVAVQKGGPSVTYTNTDTIALTVTAAGAITVQRTAGTNTHQFNAMCLYY